MKVTTRRSSCVLVLLVDLTGLYKNKIFHRIFFLGISVRNFQANRILHHFLINKSSELPLKEKYVM